MRTKKLLVTICTISALTMACLTGCSGKEESTLKDGTYTKTATEAENGYLYTMSMTVKDGKITEINWDGTDEEGNKKSVLSLEGKYVMTETGLTWAAQSEALADYVVEKQSVSDLSMDKDGKTDAVSGVSIAINGFVDYANELIAEASK